MMPLESVWPPVLLTALTLGTVALPVFAPLDSQPGQPGRHASVDGLRGFLALGVFFHHAAINHAYLETGAWLLPESAYYTLLGQAGVALFFMITGLLFWEKLIRARGRIAWRELYVSRLFRIGPLYVVVVVTGLLLTLGTTGLQLREPAGRLIVATARWLGLGLLGQPAFNGAPWAFMARLLGMVWSLRYEWLFYFSLPLLARFARTPRHVAFALTALAGSLALAALTSSWGANLLSHFLFGMLAGSLRSWRPQPPAWLGGPLASALALGALLVLGRFSQGYGAAQSILLGVFFLVISHGNALFGLLRTRAATRLGHVSYGIYLAQGLLLTVVFSIPPLERFSRSGPVPYWAVAFVANLGLLALAALLHVFLERPFIALGKRLVRPPLLKAFPRPIE